VDMIHPCQRLPLGLETGDDLAAVHAGLDDLERDLALHRLSLFGHEDGAHAALADLLQQLVRADDRAQTFAIGLINGRASLWNPLQEMPCLVMRPEQQFNAAAQLGIGTSLIQESS